MSEAAEINKAELARKLNHKVRVHVMDPKTKRPKRDEDGKHIVTESPVKAEHILEAKDRGDHFSVVTIDGKKHRVAK